MWRSKEAPVQNLQDELALELGMSKRKLFFRLTMLLALVLLTLFAWRTIQGLVRVPIDASVSAEPNPIPVCDGSGLGQTRIGWFREGFGTVQLRVGRPDGQILVHSGAFGTTETGKWVRDGLRIFLVNDSDSRVLASVTLRIDTSGCQ